MKPDNRTREPSLDLTILIPALNEAGNLESLLPDVARVLGGRPIDFEILVVDGGSGDDTRNTVERAGARFIHQSEEGYGRALAEGFEAAKGEYVLTMDADYSHEPAFIETLWDNRRESELLIASRYVPNGSAETGIFRSMLSRLLNGVYRRSLNLPFRDLSSGFRIYRRSGLRPMKPKGRDFDFLPEVLVLLYAAGSRIREVPFQYRPRRAGRSRVKLLRFGWGYLTTLLRIRHLRRPETSNLGADRSESWAPEHKLRGLKDGPEVPSSDCP